MRLILVGTDRNIFKKNTAVRDRITRYGAMHTTTLDSVVFSTRVHGIQSSQELASNVHIHPTNSFSRFLYGWDALRVANQLHRPDLVSAQDPFETGLAAYFIAQHFGVPLIVEMHTDFLSPEFIRYSFLNRVRVIIAGFVLRHAAGGYAVSERVRDEMVRRYKLTVPFAVLPIYVDLSRFELLPKNSEKGNLLWVGRLTQEKNPALAIRSVATARAAGNEVRLTLLGSGPLEASLHYLTEQLKLEEYVVFAGWGDPGDHLPAAELLLATSHYEGYGMAIVEALAAGVPVLSTDVGVAREAGATIVKGDFARALLSWLAGSRSRGVLTMPTYKNEDEYFSAVEKYDESVLHRT
jgi:glycosyltransferase involved in cell wall biosynthesis